MNIIRPIFGTLIAASLAMLPTYVERRSAAIAARVKGEEKKPYPVTKGVAEIFVEGPLFQRGLSYYGSIWWDGYDLIAERVGAALLDPEVDSIIVRIDSPGGDVAGCFEMTRGLRAAIVASGKNVFVYIDEFCASAAYALASCLSTKGIFTPREGQVGSIGVICRHTEYSKALEKAGVKVTEVTDPPGKTNGFSPFRPLDEDGEDRLREQVETYSDTFINHVSECRGIATKDVRKLDARMLIGQRAVDAKLCDGVASHSEVLARATESARNAQEARMSKSLLSSLVGLAENATAEQVEAATAQLRALVALGKEALRITGQTDKEAAKGVLIAHQEAAEKLPTVQKSLAELYASHDTSERVKICEEAVRRGIAPTLVWKDGDKAKGASDWAGPTKMVNGEQVGQSLAQLRAYVHAHQPPPTITTKHEANTEEAAARASGMSTKDVEAYASAHNVNPIAAALAAQIVGG